MGCRQDDLFPFLIVYASSDCINIRTRGRNGGHFPEDRFNLYDGEDKEVANLVQQALDQGMAPGDILQGGLIAGMDEVGRDFKAGDLFVPEVLIAARAMHAGMDVLRPLLAEGDMLSVGKCVIGTVKGDLHDIGKNLVRMMLEGAGFEMVDLGTDVDPQAFVEAVL